MLTKMPMIVHAPAHAHVMGVAGVLLDERPVDVVGPDRGEGADVAGHARHEAGDQGRDPQAQQARAQVAGHHQGKHVVVAVAPPGCRDLALRQELDVEQAQAQQARQDDDERDHHLERRADDRRHLGRPQVLGREHPLNDQEVGRPVAERDHPAQAEDDARPVDAHRVVLERAERAPDVGVVASAHALGDLRLQVRPSPRLDHAQDRDQHGPGPDQDELEHLVEDRRLQPAQGHVGGHRQRRDPDAEVDVPAQHDLHHAGHGEHVHAAHENGHERERDRREGPAVLAEAKLEVAGNGVGLGDVIEGHHHDAQEEHGRDGADPVPVGRQDAVLVGRAGPAHQLERAQVGRQEAQAGDPGRHLAAGQEEVFAGLGLPLQVPADAQHHGEVGDDDHQVGERSARAASRSRSRRREPGASTSHASREVP